MMVPAEEKTNKLASVTKESDTWCSEPRVLIVTANSNEYEKKYTLLKDTDCICEKASNGRDALRNLLMHDVDVVLLGSDLSAAEQQSLMENVPVVRPWVQILSAKKSAAGAKTAKSSTAIQSNADGKDLPSSIQKLCRRKRKSVQPRDSAKFGEALSRFGAFYHHAQVALSEGGLTTFLNAIGQGLGNLIDSAAVVVLDLADTNPTMKVVLKQDVTPVFVSKISGRMLNLYSIVTGKDLPHGNLDIRHVGKQSGKGGVDEVGDFVSFPIIIENELEGLLGFASLSPHFYHKNDIPFLYQVVTELPRIIPTWKDIQQKAVSDSFTGLYNRNYLERRLRDVWQEQTTEKQPFAVVMIDLDHFKHVNDYHGHAAGDQVLIEFAGLILSSARQTDVVARYGGDELVVLLPNADAEQAVACARRFVDAVNSHIFCRNTINLQLTSSVGVAINTAPGIETEKDLLSSADKAMYMAKEKGGGRVVSAWDVAPSVVLLKQEQKTGDDEEEPPQDQRGRYTDRGRILIIDDDKNTCSTFSQVLQHKGFQVDSEFSPSDALKHLREDPDAYDVAMVDLHMPQMNGIQVLDQLRTVAPAVVSLVVAGLAAEDEVEAALESGAFDFIRKPVNFTNMEFALQRAVQHRRLVADLNNCHFQLQQKVAENPGVLRRAYMGTMEALSAVLSVREANTASHNRRVSTYATFLARKMGLHDDRVAILRKAALVHDIGKIGVPDKVLLKPGPLNEQEWEIMQRHPLTGYKILREIPFLHVEAEVVYSHHEHYDGTGYPRGLSGEEILLEARIFAVADTFDALRSDRVYRGAQSLEHAVSEVRSGAGRQFDPKVVEAFCQCYEEMDQLFHS